jgi:hypothetical protein
VPKASKDRSLPTRPVAGDRIRLKPERMKDYVSAGEAAGYEYDPYAIREVIRVDPWAAGGGNRLFVDGAPHCFLPRDVVLAWDTDNERKAMLAQRGWLYDERRDRWLAP